MNGQTSDVVLYLRSRGSGRKRKRQLVLVMNLRGRAAP